MTDFEDPDLIAYINEGDKWISEMVALWDAGMLAATLNVLEGRQ
jgi:hypothetical protein